MNENKISTKILEETEKNTVYKNMNEMKRTILQKCKVSSQTDNFEFIDALSEMEGTYTKLCGTEYTFIHNSMFEIVAYHFGCQFPELVLQFMSSSYIANFVKLHEGQTQKSVNENRQAWGNVTVSGVNKQEGNTSYSDKSSNSITSFDLCIRLGEDQSFMIAERLFRDIENMELYDVFMNNVLKQPRVCQTFIEVLMRRTYTELKSLFLLEQEDVSKVVSKGERVSSEEREERKGEWRTPEQQRQKVLVNKRNIKDSPYGVRIISWVVYYGHSRILQYILQQTEQHNETQSGLFGKCSKLVGKCIFQRRKINQHTIEQYRLLLLSCYSGDLECVRMLMKYANRSTISEMLPTFWHYYMWNDTPLTAACQEGYMHIVKDLIEAGANVNLPGQRNTPLTAACKGGHTSVVKDLIEAKAYVNQMDEFDTPLIAACEGGHMSVVKELLKAGADVNLAGVFDSPLTSACRIGHMSIVKELLEAGADVNLQGKYHTPLTAACEGGHMSIVKELMEAGADVNLNVEDEDAPLIKVCKSGHLSIVKMLLEARAVVNSQGKFYTPLTAACKYGQMSVVKELLKAGADPNLQDVYNTPLTSACKGGNMNVVKELLEAGADANLQDEINTPLTSACKGGHMSVVKKLLKAGADVNLQVRLADPMTASRKVKDWNVIDKLLEGKTDDFEKCKSKTPLTAACMTGHLSILKVLLEAGADVNLKDEYYTPLTAACKSGHIIVVKELLDAGADVNLQDRYDTPLRVACKSNHMNVMKELLEAGADVNQQDRKGQTSLYLTVLQHTKTVVHAVLVLNKYGADSSICNKEGLSPLYIALVNNKGDVVTQLLRTENERQLNRLKLHFFDCLVNIRHSDVMTDSKDDVMVTQRRVWRMKECGDLFNTILSSEYNGLKHLLGLGLDVNQWIQLYRDSDDENNMPEAFKFFLRLFERSNEYESDMRPLLFLLIDKEYAKDKVGKVRILLEAGVDVNVRVRYREYESVLRRERLFFKSSSDEDDNEKHLDRRRVLDRAGVSVQERTRRLVSKYRKSKYEAERSKVSEYKRVLSEVKKHVRRYSV